jgi:hypothetical protein
MGRLTEFHRQQPPSCFGPPVCGVQARQFRLARHEIDSRARAWAVDAARGWARHDKVAASAKLARHEIHRALLGPCQGRAGWLEWTSIPASGIFSLKSEQSTSANRIGWYIYMPPYREKSTK